MSQSVMRKIVLPVGIVLVAVVLLLVLKHFRPQPTRHKPPQPRPVVTIYTIESEADKILVRGFGSIKAKRSIEIVPQVSGEVIEKAIDFEPGGYFTAGKILLRIDDTDYLLARERAAADVAQAEYSLALAEEEAQVAQREWQRVGSTNLLTGDEAAAGPTSLVLREPQLKMAQASLTAALAALRQAEVNLARCSITAPFDGRVLNTDIDQGQYLRAGAAIGSIYATDVAEVTISVRDDDLAWIAVAESGCPAGPATTVDVSAEFAGARHHWVGRAVRLGGAVDERSRLVPVVVEIDHPYEMSGNRPPLVEGMFVEVVFSGEPPAAAVVIPRGALRPNNQVWVIDEQGKIRISEVELARAGVDQAVISAGLVPGQRVCTSNLQFVTEGLPVRIEGEPVPAQVDTAATSGVKDGDR